MHRRNTAVLAASTSLALTAAGRGLALPRAIQSFRPRADVQDPARVLADLTKAFEDFKTAHAESMKGKADVVALEKVDRINTAVGDLQAEMDKLNARIAAALLNGGGGGQGAQTPDQKAYADKFNAWFRHGLPDESELRAMAVKAALTTQSDPDGGYLTTREIEQAISRVQANVCAMRGLAQIQTIGGASYKKKVSIGGAGSGWVGEEEARPATGTPQISVLEFTPGEIYAKPEATQSMLDDGDVDIGQWLADEVSITFTEQEGLAFISGTGVKKPRGILGYPIVANPSYAWGKVGYIASTGASDFAASNPEDQLIDLMQALKVSYRANANWLMNRATVGKVRKFKDSTGQYLWEPSNKAGQPATLLGYPVSEDDNMPDVGANAYPIAFGDFRRGYMIVDRMGVRVTRDPFSNKPFVQFYTTKRVGGGIQNFEAIKLFKIATS